MEIYFLRHGKAVEPGSPGAPDDFSRALTARGIEEMEAEAEALVQLGLLPDLILTSPLVRARQTAAIAAERLHLKKQLIESELLGPGFNLARLKQLTDQVSAKC